MQQVVTQQAVDAAADAIVAAGGKPTFRLINQRVGGSFTTLKPMLANWEERRGKGAEAVIEVPDALLARGADLVRGIFAEVAQQARVESEAVRKDAEARVTEVRAELSEATEEIARLEAQDLAKAAELSSLRDEHKTLELLAAGLKERAALAARLESELRDARAALAKSEQQVTDLQAQLVKAGDVQKLLSNLEARLGTAGVVPKGKM
ncbi:MAG: DNA-binding protein [Betaproteobacteria bacterium HGW-Betaproteobacteria-9]|jgi:chromosome segregation ATPase|nr:MAG: DNA-binding protein [Betaproteobacteria bacterium HGW-Betaproteobacteria-9]